MVYEQKERGDDVRNTKSTVKRMSNEDAEEKCTETQREERFHLLLSGSCGRDL